MARESAFDPTASTRTLWKIQAPATRPSAVHKTTRSTRLRPSSRTSASRNMGVSSLVLCQLLNTTVGSVACQARERSDRSVNFLSDGAATPHRQSVTVQANKTHNRWCGRRLPLRDASPSVAVCSSTRKSQLKRSELENLGGASD